MPRVLESVVDTLHYNNYEHVWALCVLSVTRYNSAEKCPIEAGSNQQSFELQPSMLSTQPHSASVLVLLVLKFLSIF